MPILNYTTKIVADKTAGEVLNILAKAGVQTATVMYENFQPSGISFSFMVQTSLLNFQLPLRWRGVLKVLERQKGVPYSARNEAQARRVAWRIIKDLVAAQLAFVQSGQAEIPELFLPFVVNEEGRTLGDLVRDQPERLLPMANQYLLAEGKG